MKNRSPAQAAFRMVLAASLILLVVIPLVYFVCLSFFSTKETYQFPQSLFPKTSFQFRVSWADEKYKVDVYDAVTGEYEPLLNTSRMSEISRLLRRQFSVQCSTDELTRDFEIVKTQGPTVFTYEKDFLYNYKSFFSVSNGALEAMKNSVIAALWTILISLTLGSMAGYALARYHFWGKSQINMILLVVRMFPVVAISIPLAVDLINLGLFDTMFGVAVIYSIPNIALTSWITYSIFLGVSTDLEEAAYVFGAGKIRAFLNITLPLAFPGLAASAMYAFLAAWNDTITSLILTSDHQTLSLVIYKAIGGNDAQLQIAAAGCIILIIPALVFTFIIKNYIGQMWGEVKV